MVKSAVRTLDILVALAAAPAGLSHTDLARALKIPKSSLSALLRSLADKHWIDADPDSGRLALGPAVLGLASAFLGRVDVLRTAQPHLRGLRDRLGETTTLVVLRDAAVLTVGQEPGPQQLSAVMRPGDMAPALATASGRAIVAFLPEAERERLLAQHAARPGVAMESLRGQLEAVRNGEVARCEQEWIPGLVAFARPIFGPDREPLAAIGAAVPHIRLDTARRVEVSRAVAEAAAAASARLGG